MLMAPEREVPSGGTRPDHSIYHAPTRISSSIPPSPKTGWGSNYGRPLTSQEMPSTHASLYAPNTVADQSETRPRLRQARPEAALPGLRTRRFWLILGSLAILAVVFASGAGVAVYVLGGRGNHATATSTPRPTLAPSFTPTPIEKVIFTDPLTSSTNPWPVNAEHCQFKNGSYQVRANYICFAPIGVQSNIAISVQVKQLNGTTAAFFGICFRYVSHGNYYNFLINSNSLWSFAKFVNNQGTALVSEKADPAIKPGLNIVNTLLVRMQGGHIDFFVDGTKIGAADDATFSAGLIGLEGADNTDVAFNNFQVATLR
jgi:hypothetical protein